MCVCVCVFGVFFVSLWVWKWLSICFKVCNKLKLNWQLIAVEAMVAASVAIGNQ